MRHFLLALMIVLLPLRGWAGDAMAPGMAAAPTQHQQLATEFIATHAYESGSGGHFDHQTASHAPAQTMHDCAEQVDGQPAQAGNAHDGHCSTCESCQACHTLALSLVAPDLNTAFNASAQPRAMAMQFTSAPAARGQKPPIS